MLHPGKSSVSPEKLQWQDLSLKELEIVLKSEEVTGEPEDYQYVRGDGTLHLFNDESSIEVPLESEQTAETAKIESKAQTVETTGAS
ncbi:MAG: hypothetical protein CMN92_03515 [Synechococcus sp. CPC100]|nr:hypothetical protein [Synechococcus sp. CPC100]